MEHEAAGLVDVKIEALEYLRTKRVTEQKAAARDIARIDAELATLRSGIAPVVLPVHNRFAPNTDPKATPLALALVVMRELHRPMTTREIADQLISRGVFTTAHNFVASLFATLANSKAFARQSGKWVLVTGSEGV